MTTFSLFNLNIMHGRNRKNAVFPVRLSREVTRRNLQKIADCIHKHSPDIVTLQEVDQPSMLSGNFNQFDWLAIKLEYPHKYFAPSCSITLFGKKIFISGNAIFSRFPLEHCESYNFDFSFPTDRMGFVIADAKLPRDKMVTIVSVHTASFDWTRLNSRAHQLRLVEKVITTKQGGVVIAGDLNCDFMGNEDSMRSFVHRLDLVAHEPDSNELPTYPSWNPSKRIDWILASKELKLISYKTIKDRLSDHLAVFADISV